MRNYREIFPKKNTFLVVVHAEKVKQAIKSAEIAFSEGADRIFLIKHGYGGEDLVEIYYEIRQKYGEEWIGLNFLSHGIIESIAALPDGASGLWVDNAGLHQHPSNPLAVPRLVRDYRKSTDMRALYFGGVAFKYQPRSSDPALDAVMIAPFVEVVTTSGEGTGKPPSIQKIQSMSNALRAEGDYPLAIASGMTVANIEPYKEFTDCFLVSTGISFSHTELDPVSVGRMAATLDN